MKPSSEEGSSSTLDR